MYRIFVFAFLALALFASACSSGSQLNTGGNLAQPQPGQTAQILVRHVLLRAVPSEVTHFRFLGTDSNNNVVYGPDRQPKAAEIILTVPITTVNLNIEYLVGNTVVGIFQTPVSLTAGGQVVIEDPNWTPVTGGVPVRLSFQTPPSNSAPSAPITPAVQVAIVDVNGDVVTSAANPITVALGNNPTGASLGGTLTVEPINGVASFPDLIVNLEGTDYTLTGSATGLEPATSVPFLVSRMPVASTLSFAVQPSNNVLGQPIAPPVQVEVLDQFGQRFDANGPISLALTQNLNGALLQGTTSVNAVNGLATFSDLTLTRAGTGFTLTANGAGVNPATSQPFDVTVQTFGGFVTLARLCPTGPAPTHVAPGDYNGDGRTDLAVTNAENDTVSILLGNAAGGFTPAPIPTLAADDRPVVVEEGDLNGDGRLDLLVGHRSDSILSFFAGNGDGSFQARVDLNVAGDIRGLALGDLDGDGDLDAVVAYPFSNQGEVFINDGVATLTGLGPFGGLSRPAHVALGQLNPTTDSIPDVIFTNDQANTITVGLGNGAGGFAFTPFGVGTRPKATSIGDLNGDGFPDLVTANHDSDDITIYRGDGLGGFTLNTTIPAGDGARWPAIVDLNGDGALDLALGCHYENSLRLFLNDGAGVFTAGAILAGGNRPAMVAPLDFTGDGLPDLIVAPEESDGVVLQPNLGGGIFPTQNDLNPGVDTRFVISLDFNGDGHLDLAATEGNANQIAFFPGIGDGTFGARVGVSSGGTRPQEMAAADFNGDGRPDLAVANFNSDNATVHLNDGLGGFTQSADLPTGGTDPFSIAAGDLNGDAHQDFVVSHRNSNFLRAFFGDGTGQFPTNLDLPLASSCVCMRLGDVNGDGRLDIVAGERWNTPNRIVVFLADGAGGFPTVIPTSVVGSLDARYISLGDLDGDGNLDLTLVNRDGNDLVLVYKGDGQGGFTLLSFLAALVTGNWPPPHVGEIVNLNNDGIPDVAVADQEGYLRLFLGEGQGFFQPYETLDDCLPLAGNSPFHLAAGDFDEDGLPDLAIVNHFPGGSNTAGGITILLQQP